jgi:hypothetical protein
MDHSLNELSEAEKVESKATIGGMNHDDDDDAKQQVLVLAPNSSRNSPRFSLSTSGKTCASALCYLIQAAKT